MSALVTFQPGFESLAERDLRRADPRSKSIGTLEPGLWLVRPGPESSVLRFVEGLAGPEGAIAIRHVHPVTVDVEASDLAAIVQAVAPLGALLPAGEPYAVQTRIVGPGNGLKAIAVNDAVAEALAPLGVPYDRKHPTQVVSVTLVAAPDAVRILAGAGPTVNNLSAWPGGARRFARVEGSPSRAEHKLLEALEVFGFEPEGRALDLGAAPGGWTKVLAERGMNVVAIDPADLDPAVAALPGVRAYRGTAERYLAARGAVVDLVVNDMRMDARDAARLLLQFRPLLAAHGHVLTTLKLPERGFLLVLDQAFEILGEGFRRLGARQLFHNRNEVTVLLAPS